ncbi:hypothetical protein [Thiomicrorhabdus sp. Milos-T2]|uniref:hypothetical protein n=1 Tax=Thiomicrorhabdus sp. Milos-T2 TaxID=90814 RepID=UPI000494037E|nr:hypothetical protein [Thiomicrorhabdus sp. Milos-T2]
MKRLKFLAKRYGHKVAAQYLSNETKRKHQLEQRIVNKIAELDPTKGKRYTQWLLREYIVGAFDLKTINKSEVRQRLVDFERYSIMLSSKDIGTYNWRKLIKKLEPYQNVMGAETLSNREVQRLYRQRLVDTLAVHIWYENKKIKTKVIQLLSEEAAIYYGKGTRWCVSAKKNNAFDYYASLGDLFFIQFKGKKFLFQVSFYSDKVSFSVADAKDQFLVFSDKSAGIFPFRKEDIEFGQIVEILLVWCSLKKGISLRLSRGTVFEGESINETLVKGLTFNFILKNSKVTGSTYNNGFYLPDRKLDFIQTLVSIKQSYPDEIRYRMLARLSFNPPEYLFEELVICYPFLIFIMNYKNKQKLQELASESNEINSFLENEAY